MYKKYAVLLLTCSLSTSAYSAETENQTSDSKEVNIIHKVFNLQQYRCDDWPECGITEEEQMALESEANKAVYESTSESDDSNKN